MDKFKVDFNEWKQITPDTAHFYFSQSEKRLKETIETSKIISESARRLMAILLPLFLATVGLSVGYFPNDFVDGKGSMTWLLIVLVVLIGTCLYILIEIGMPRAILTTGSMPKNIIRKEPIIKQKESGLQYLDILLNECESYQIRIDQNIETNVLRSARLRKVYNILNKWIPIVCFLFWVLDLVLPYFTTS